VFKLIKRELNVLKPVRTKKDYQTAVNRNYELMKKNIKINSDYYDELEVLSIFVENYENKNFPIEMPDPVEAIKFRLEQLNLEISALAQILGSKRRASEILDRKRKLSIGMIRTLHKKLNILAASLIADYSK
jgi:HTH-type transcriptional regulator/antitoxin HigA